MSEIAVYWMGMDVAKKTFDAALVRPGETERVSIYEVRYGEATPDRWIRVRVSNVSQTRMPATRDTFSAPILSVVRPASCPYHAEYFAGFLDGASCWNELKRWPSSPRHLCRFDGCPWSGKRQNPVVPRGE